MLELLEYWSDWADFGFTAGCFFFMLTWSVKVSTNNPHRNMCFRKLADEAASNVGPHIIANGNNEKLHMNYLQQCGNSPLVSTHVLRLCA